MEPEIAIHTPEDSAISAYGISPPRFPWFFIIPSAILVSLLLFFTLFGWFLSRPISIPSHTLLLLTVRPKTAATVLSPQTTAVLPEPWRTSLHERSNWPVLFGARLENGVWQTFTVGPRWTKSALAYPTQTHGLAKFNGTLADTSSTSITYGHFLWSWFTSFRSPAIGEIDPTVLLTNSNTTSSSITFSIAKKTIRTNLMFENKKTNDTPLILASDHDVSLDFARIENTPFASLLTHTLRWGEQDLSQLSAAPQHIHVTLNSDKEFTHLQLLFPQVLSIIQKQELLAQARVVEKHIVRLPDGSLSTERHFPSAEEASSTSTFTSSLGTITFQDHQADFSYPSSTSTPPSVQNIKACGRGQVVARLSPIALQTLSQGLVISLPSELVSSGIQFIEEKNQLTICQESP